MNDLKIKILGSACPYPSGGKNGQGLLIKYNGQNILVNCGCGITRLMNFPDDIDNLSIIITSLRPEYISDLETLCVAINEVKKRGYDSRTSVNLYLPDGNKTLETRDYPAYGRIRAYTATNEVPSERYQLIMKQLSEYPIKVTGISKLLLDNISVYKTIVNKPESYALSINTYQGNLAYIGNVDDWTMLKKFKSLNDCDYLICGAEHTFGDIRRDGNMYANEAAKLAKLLNADKLILTQLYPEKQEELYLNEARRYFENVEVAKEGKVYVMK